MRTKLPSNAILVPAHAVRVFRGIIYDVYHWEQELYDGSMATYEMLKRPDTVKVIAVADNKIVVLEQEQSGLKVFYDIPGGMHDHEDEDELQAAQRELLEETGLTFKTWKLLNVVQPNRKIEQFVYTFLATELENEVQQELDNGEKINVHLMTFDEAKKVLASEKGRFIPSEIASSQTLNDLLSLSSFE